MNLVMALVPAAALAAGNYLVAVQPGCIACTAWLVAGPFVLALLLGARLPRLPARAAAAPAGAAPPPAAGAGGALGRVLAGAGGGAFAMDAGWDPGATRLTGNVAGAPPFRGVLRHGGWRVKTVTLPVRRGQDARVVAPAEVEIA